MGTINLALAPEEVTLLDNLEAIIQQLRAMQGAPEEGVEGVEGIVEEAMPPETPEEEMQKAMQDETGDDKAEDRLDNQTDVTDESMTDLKKNLALLTGLLGKKKTVQKSRTNDPVLQEFKKLNKTLEGITNRLNEQDEFNHTLMNAVGVADDMVAKTLETTKQPTNSNKPIQGKDMALFAQELVTQIFKNMPQNQNQIAQNTGNQHPFNEKYYDSQVNKDMCKVVDFVCKAQKGVA